MLGAIMNKAVLSICVYRSLCECVFMYLELGVQFLRQYVKCVFNFTGLLFDSGNLQNGLTNSFSIIVKE